MEEIQYRRKPKEKKTKAKIGRVLVTIFLVIYIPSLFYWVYGGGISTDIVRMGTIEDSINADGLIVRDEEVLKSPFEGKCISEIGEGEKISVNSRVATVLKDSSIKLLDDLKDLDLRIIKAQKEKVKNEDYFSTDVVKIDNEIAQEVQFLITQSNMNSLGKVKQIKDNIDTLIEKKASIVGNTSTSDVYLNSLKKDKENMQQKINANTKEIISKSSGIVSYVVDGYEGELNPNSINQLTPKIIDDVKPKGSKVNANNLNITTDKPFAKVIKDFEYHIVFPLNVKDSERVKLNDSVSIRINDINKTIDGIIDYKSGEIEGKSVIAVKVDKLVSDTADLRKINLDLVMNYHEGLKVPLRSLKDVDLNQMTAKIVLVKANYSSIREISIMGANSESAIVKSSEDPSKSGVSLYDIFVINPKNIQEGQMIN